MEPNKVRYKNWGLGAGREYPEFIWWEMPRHVKRGHNVSYKIPLWIEAGWVLQRYWRGLKCKKKVEESKYVAKKQTI